MNLSFPVILNLLAFGVIFYGLFYMQKKHYSFTARVLTALVLGIVFGAVLQMLYPSGHVISDSVSWFSIVGTGYVRLLNMIVIPLILVSITTAIINLKDGKNLGKMSGLIIGILLFTTLISAAVGAATATTFQLNAATMQQGETEKAKGEALKSKNDEFAAKPIQQQLVEIIPTNPFYAMTGQGSAPTLSTVLFSAMIGISVLGLKKKKPEAAQLFINGVNAFHDVVMRLVQMVLRLTPYGVLALMAKMVATSNFAEISRLMLFVVASYVAIFIMFAIHMALIAANGLNPFAFMKNILPVLTFAFTSRSSAATLPLNIETQINKLGVSEGHANLSASLGTSIGQNGCAGIYPAMLAVMIAPTIGVPLTLGFMIKLVIIVALGSFGIAGVGGGATFAALVVLSSLGFPVELVGLLIAIEPLIDMGRTALNVSGAMTTGVISSKLMNELNMETYKNSTTISA